VSEERRSTERVPLVLEVEYRTTGHLLVSYCANLSRGGLFVATDDPLPVGTRLTLMLSIPGGGPNVAIDAEVRWTDAGSEASTTGMGLAFEGIDDVLGDEIDRVIKDVAPIRIDIVGNPEAVWQHIAALVQSLVRCEVTNHELEPGVEYRIATADVVIVDVDAAPKTALALLAQVAPHTPTLALCSLRSDEVLAQARTLARVVPTPVDSRELQRAVLRALSDVSAKPTSTP